MRQIKEHDLILLTSERIEIPGHDNDVKKVTNEDFLRSYLIKQCAMFAFVTGKNIGSPKDPSQSGASIDVLIDFSKATYLKLSEQELGYAKLYVYVYESLATTFREYKTLRMSEFYAMSEILLKPQPQKSFEALEAEELAALGEGEDVKLMRQ